MNERSLYSRADGFFGIDALQQLRFGVGQIHPTGAAESRVRDVNVFCR